MGVTIFFPPAMMAVEVARKDDVIMIGDVVVGKLKGKERAHRVNGVVVFAVVVGVNYPYFLNTLCDL